MTFLKRYLLPRILQYFVVIFVGCTIVFIVTRMTPSDPIQKAIERITMHGTTLDPEIVEEVRQALKELYGLEGSVLFQYFTFWKRSLLGDFGPSFSRFPAPVMYLITNSLPWTAGLLILTAFIGWVIGSILGGLTGYFNQKGWARTLETITMVLRPLPYYIVALLILILLAYIFPLFPISGGVDIGRKMAFRWDVLVDVIKHAFLPALSLVIVIGGVWFVQMRSLMTTTIREDYVEFGRVAGLPHRKLIFQYSMRNAILPQITGLALSMGQLLSGALITEYVFAYPGVGFLLYTGIVESDYNLVMGITVLSIIFIATAVLIIDLIYPVFDPRIRYQ